MENHKGGDKYKDPTKEVNFYVWGETDQWMMTHKDTQVRGRQDMWREGKKVGIKLENENGRK